MSSLLMLMYANFWTSQCQLLFCGTSGPRTVLSVMGPVILSPERDLGEGVIYAIIHFKVCVLIMTSTSSR